MNHLLVYNSEADIYYKLLQEYDLPELEITPCFHENDARKALQNCNILLGEPAIIAGVLNDAKRLKWVQSTFAGVEALCTENLRRDYTLTGIKDFFGPLMSEYVFAYILAIERQLWATKENQKARAWIEMPCRGLQGLNFGICGLGSIGKKLAQTARHFGMRVFAFKRTYEETPFVERVYTGSSFKEFLGLLDYLVLVLPYTPATTGLINHEALKNMKPSAVIINVGRGNAVVNNDLAAALKNNTIRAAVLDVFDEEPLPADSVLWGLSNAYITPHNSALSFPENVATVFHENYLLFFDKKPLKFVIDFERGY